MRLRIAAALTAITLSLPALAQQAAPAKPDTAPQIAQPTPEAIQSFWEFYFKGQGGGPALADAKLCLEITREGPNKFECAREMPEAGIKAGTSVIVWQAYLLPYKETVDDLSLQVLLGDTVRETKDIKLRGESIRTRNLTTVRLPKAGTWTLKLLRGGKTLRTFTVKAS